MTPSDEHPIRVAIIGGGIAGASCARLLADAGFAVTVFDKSRGVGGRMATRRAQLIQPDGTATPMMFDHGVPFFDAGTSEFETLLRAAQVQGVVEKWSPRIRSTAVDRATPLPSREDRNLWVATPDMPSLCRWLLQGVEVRTNCAVQALQRNGVHWKVLSDSVLSSPDFDAVVVTIPPRQAADLWEPIHPAWAIQARHGEMTPCWTLMGTTRLDESDGRPSVAEGDWDLFTPFWEVISIIVRQDRKPGRSVQAGMAQWVVHAHAAWSRDHLESSPEEVQAVLQASLEQALAQDQPGPAGSGHGLSLAAHQLKRQWLHAVVHRWRYAQSDRRAAGADEFETAAYWWDASSGLGACGDHMIGAGVEDAWRSGRALARAMRSAHA